MAERFTGFWETTEDPPVVATTLGPIHVEDLIERLRQRLLEIPPGVNIRIDLISWEQ